MRLVGTTVRGIRTPIIKENDDFVSQSVVNVYIYRVLKVSDRMCFISKVLVE